MDIPASAQVQQAWVARYNNGLTNGTNQAVKMALDSAGNIYVTGFSQNASGNLGYVTIKYAPSGSQVWATRYDSSSYKSATPSGLILDNSNNVIVTGSAITIKYDLNGDQVWAAPYNAASIAADGSNNVYITGVSQNFETIKLSPTGSNLWTAVDTGNYSGPQNVAQLLAVDLVGNTVVAGDEILNSNSTGVTVAVAVVKYNSEGGIIWRDTADTDGFPYVAGAYVDVSALVLDMQTNPYVVLGSSSPSGTAYSTFKIASSGNLIWTASPASGNVHNTAYGIALSSANNVLLVGQEFHMGDSASGTISLTTNGSTAWSALYPAAYTGTGGGMSIAVDLANNSYVTGYSPGANSSNDIVTIAYGPNGNQLWLQRYHGPGGGDDAGNAIAVDNNGNVYVTGYEATTAGGTEIVTIKYSPLILQKQANGSFLLQAQGSPGEGFDIQASADLINWQDLGSVLADTNGLMQFADTNAASHPARFYITNPQ